MFMSTRYKKKDPEWRKKWLFNVDDSLANLLECLSIEYSVSKLISPKWKNFRSQKLKFESKTRINNAIWRCWHIQYKESKRPRFIKFDMPFSDQTVHSTPQAVILEGKTWKKRLDIVSREYKKWRKFYNVKILKGGGEDTDNLKQQLSNENSEDEFSSDEEEDNKGRKHRQSPTKNPDVKTALPNQKLFQSSDLMLDTYLADLPDTLFSSIRPMKPAADNALGLTYTDLSDMIQPTLDQLNPCFDELLQNFDFLTNDWGNLQSNTRPIEPTGQSVTPLHDMLDGGGLQSGLINTGNIYNEPLTPAAGYLYSSEVLYAPNLPSAIDKRNTEIDTFAPMLSKESGDEGLQFTASSSARKKESGKRSFSDVGSVLDSSLPKKVLVKEVDKTSQFLNDVYLQKGQINREVNVAPAEGRSDHMGRPSNFEALLSNAIDMSANQSNPLVQAKPVEGTTANSIPNRALEQKGMSIDTVEEIISVDTQFSQKKMFVNQIATTKVVEYSELPPQLQAPNLTAHLQAVMSTRTANPAMPRNKSDTQLSMMADKFALPQSLKVSRKELSPLVKGKQANSNLPRNRSDSNLVQMSKDTCRVYARRRMASISVDTKPLIFPRNFSDSNLCSLGRGVSRRPQPILPKNLIGIVPPSQSRASCTTVSKATSSQLDTVPGQKVPVGGQFSSFLVNRQQPTSTDPVQVTLYMPKSRKTAQVPAVPKDNITVSKQGNPPPQRVEVIQYKGNSSAEQGSKAVGIVPAVAVAPTVSSAALPPSSAPRQLQSVPTHRDNTATVGQHATYAAQHQTFATSKDLLNLAPPASNHSQVSYTTLASAFPVTASPHSSVLHRSKGSDSLSSLQSPGKSTENITAPNLPVGASNAGLAQVPINLPADAKAESIAPLQGFSDQQLVSLAQILRGSRSGDIGQETTIAYLEMLQKQLNTLLEQQHDKARPQQVSAENTSGVPLNLARTTETGNQSLERDVNLSYPNLSSATPVTASLASGPLPSANLPASSLASITMDAANHSQPGAPWSQRLHSENNVVGSGLRQSHGNMLPRENLHFNTQMPTQQAQRPEAGSVPQNNHNNTLVSHLKNQTVETRDQKWKALNKSNIPPNQGYSATGEAPFMKISDVSYFPGVQHSVPQQSMSFTDVNPNILRQNHSARSTTLNVVNLGSQIPQKTLTSNNSTMSIQQPILLGMNPGGLASTVDASVLTLSVVPPLNPTQSTVLVSPGVAIPSQSNLVPAAGTDADDKQKTTGTSVRPTMVDLAIAASQRTYLTDNSSVKDSSSQVNTQAVVKTSSAASIESTSTVRCISQPISTGVISGKEASPPSSTESAGVKRSRLRFQDREMYKEYRRKNHVTAEQKRRGLIKVAFDQMIALIPSLQEDRHGRTSKALVLQKGADYIDHLQRERELTKYKIEKLRREVNRLNEEIKVCQEKLPACGAVSEQQSTRDAKTSYLEHIRQRIVMDPKYWLFCVMLRPLFESFNENTSTRTLQDFIQSVLQWSENNCSLTVLRPAVISSLRQISTHTPLLTNPSALPDHAQRAARCPDPTLLGQQPTLSNAESSQNRPGTHMEATTSTPTVVGVPNTVIVASQPVRLAIQPQQIQQQEFMHSRQSYVTWSAQFPPFKNDLQ